MSNKASDSVDQHEQKDVMPMWEDQDFDIVSHVPVAHVLSGVVDSVPAPRVMLSQPGHGKFGHRFGGHAPAAHVPNGW